MRRQLISFTLAVVLASPCIRSQRIHTNEVRTDIGAGNVSGKWTLANSPYHVLGEITIRDGETLAIEPGVEVVFMGHYKLNVQGRLVAVGTQRDTIRFTADNTQLGWHGIRFIGTPNTNDTSKIVYCELTNGKANTGSGLDRSGGALLISGFDKVLVSHSLFHSNMNSDFYTTSGGPAIYLTSASPVISNSTFTANTGTTDGAIACWGASHAIISKNIFSNNHGTHGGILCANYNSTSPTISGNIISQNIATVAGGALFMWMSTATIENNIILWNQSPEGAGIKCYMGASPICINNTIVCNIGQWGGGLCCNGSCEPILINNIMWGNTGVEGSQVCLMDIYSDPTFLYCDIQGGMEGFRGNGAGASYGGRYEECIDSDPLWLDPESGDFRLSCSSPCIGAGIESVQVAGAWHHVPAFCIEGNPRPSPAGTRPDLGAHESLLGSPEAGFAYAHDVHFTRHGRDTVGITARVENALDHFLRVVAILTSGSGTLIDSLFLKDDGSHGDSASADGLWGCLYVPGKDDTIRVTIRTDDLSVGTSRKLLDIVHMVFTRGAMICVDTRTIDIGAVNDAQSRYDTTFTVYNIGFARDSLTVFLDPVNVDPDSAVAVSPLAFELAAGDTQNVTFSVRPRLLGPSYYCALITVKSKEAYGQPSFMKVFSFQKVMTAIRRDALLPDCFMLRQNFPNPFNPTTTIQYELPRASRVKLTVFNTLGQEVARLVNDMRDPGTYTVSFDASGLSSGVYLYRLVAGNFTQCRKLVLMR